MKSIIKKTIFILTILIILFSINTKVFAWSGIISNGDEFIKSGENYGEIDMDTSSVQDLSGYIYNILLAAGVIVAVIVATILGIQFMIGGAEGQAKVKEMLVPFIVGCIIVFGGFGFWKIAVTLGKKIDSSTEQSKFNYEDSDRKNEMHKRPEQNNTESEIHRRP